MAEDHEQFDRNPMTGETLQSPGREMLAARAGAIFGDHPEQDVPEPIGVEPEPAPAPEIEHDEFGAHIVTEDGESVTAEDVMLDPPSEEDEDHNPYPDDVSESAHEIGDHDADPYHEDPVDHDGLDHDHDEAGELTDPQRTSDDTEK